MYLSFRGPTLRSAACSINEALPDGVATSSHRDPDCWQHTIVTPPRGPPVYEPDLTKYSQTNPRQTVRENIQMEVTKALAALKPLYGMGNIEVVTQDGHRVRGIVRSMKTTQALTRPSVKIERADGETVKIPFSSIIEIVDHNPPQ